MIHVLALLLSTFAHGAFTVPGFELVVTSPVETTLGAEDLRGPIEVWKEMIQGAKKRIDLGQMYAAGKAGEPLDEVIQALEDAAKRGVKIRFMLEENMKRASIEETVERLKKIKGLELRTIKFANVSGDGIVHAKYIVVDGGASAFVGSQNFDWRSLKHIEETGLLITDKTIARQVQAIFDHDWQAWATLAAGRKVKPLNTKSVAAPIKSRAYLVASPNAHNPKGVADSEAELVRLIGSAKEEIRIQLLDYYPLNRDKTFYPPLDNALRAALARGVKVKMLVSHWNTGKPGVDHLKSLSVVPGMEVRVLTIPQAKEGPIPFARVNHSKFMTVDGKTAWVGTSNWTGGYLNTSRNLEVVVNDETLAKRLGAVQGQMWDSAYAAPLDVSKNYPQPNKGAE